MQSSIRSMCLGFALALGPCALGACAGATPASEAPAAPESAAHPLLGKRGPDFARKTVKGNVTISLRGLTGRVTVVDFWATWCGPCRKSFPKLEALNAKYGSNGLQIVGISEDDDTSGIPAFASGLGAKFPMLWDENKTIASKWQPRSMPSTFILDRQGTIRFVHLGYHDHEEAAIEREIKSLL